MMKDFFKKIRRKIKQKKTRDNTQKQNNSNSKTRKTSLTLGEDKLLAAAVQEYSCYINKIKAIDLIKKKIKYKMLRRLLPMS